MRIRYLLLVTCVAACGGESEPAAPQRPTFFTATERPVCLALSVGGPAGLAHLGAIEAVKQAGLDVQCVVGNSMGALVGSLYATAPEARVSDRYRAYVAAYVEESKREAGGRGVLGALFGIGLAAITGGSSLMFGAAGARMGASTTPELDHARSVKVLDAFYDHAQLEDLPVEFAAYHVELDPRGVDTRTSRKGSVADSVGKSIANPLLFPDFDAKRAGYVDPGVDRISRTPIEDTCALFPHSRILAVNVTGQKSFHSADLSCPLLEVRVEAGEVPRDAMKADGPGFEAAVEAGRRSVARALRETADSPRRGGRAPGFVPSAS